MGHVLSTLYFERARKRGLLIFVVELLELLNVVRWQVDVEEATMVLLVIFQRGLGRMIF